MMGLWRGMLPPWANTPLVSPYLRPQHRLKPGGCSILTALALTGGLLGLYLLSGGPYNQGNLVALLVTSLALIISFIYWRLLGAILSRSAAAIAARRLRGDWDLIAIAPLDKGRWLRAQTIILGWSVWPLVRWLMIALAVLILISFGYLSLYLMRNESDLYPPLGLYWLGILPIGILMLCGPSLNAGLFTAVGLYVSSHTRRPNMALLYSLGGVYALRVLMMLVLLLTASIGGVIASGSALETVYWFDLGSTDLVLMVSSCCIWALILAFLAEWPPMLLPLLLLAEIPRENQIALTLVVWVSLFSAYILLPLWLMRRLEVATIHRLEQPER